MLHAVTPARTAACLLHFVATLSISLPTAAQNSFGLELLNPGEIMVNLSASEQTAVEQDTLNATLYYAAQGRDRIALQDEVNRIMTEALELLAASEIEYSTQQYRVYQVSPARPVRSDADNPLWRAQQGVRLTGRDSAALLDLVAGLQEMGLAMNGLDYSLSDRRRQEVQDALMESALNRLRDRSQAVADALDKGGFEIVEITMDSGGNGGIVRSSAMSLSAEAMDVATPVAEPGVTTVSFAVTARVILVP